MQKFLIGLLSVLIIFGIGVGFSFYQFMQSKAYVHRTIVPQIPDPSETPEWATLLDKYSRICIEDRTAACMIDAALNLHIQIYMQSGAIPHDLTHYNAKAQKILVDYIVSFGQKNAAAKILPYVDSNKKGTRTRLLYLSGDYQKADRELLEANKVYEEASDYGAVWSLTTRGDYNKALEIARIVLQWQHPPTYTVQTTVACSSNYSEYPRGIGRLAHFLATQGRYKEALEIKELLKRYIKNKYNGRWFFTCYQLHGLQAYLDAAFGIADSYMQDKQTERALSVYQGIVSFGEEMSAVLHKENDIFENEIKRHGLLKKAIKLGWLENKDYIPYTPKKHCDSEKIEAIPATATDWREKLDTCGKTKKHRRYGTDITEKEQMLHCYMDTLENLQIKTVYKNLPWQC